LRAGNPTIWLSKPGKQSYISYLPILKWSKWLIHELPHTYVKCASKAVDKEVAWQELTYASRVTLKKSKDRMKEKIPCCSKK
jgi:hypothetical protein